MNFDSPVVPAGLLSALPAVPAGASAVVAAPAVAVPGAACKQPVTTTFWASAACCPGAGDAVGGVDVAGGCGADVAGACGAVVGDGLCGAELDCAASATAVANTTAAHVLVQSCRVIAPPGRFNLQPTNHAFQSGFPARRHWLVRSDRDVRLSRRTMQSTCSSCRDCTVAADPSCTRHGYEKSCVAPDAPRMCRAHLRARGVRIVPRRALRSR